ncbi:MAG TPA: hypothetical protein VFQ58_02265, partial [Flavisolibacter sp.]|nr:hypothetical protein [Flavisolibacter sp.]
MNSSTIYKALQSKFTSIVVLLIAIIAKMIQQLYFFSTTLDRTAQLIEAKNLLSGHGLTINKLAENGIAEVFTPVAAWPPGYPVIVSGISALTHLHILTSAIVFDVLSIFLFLFFSRKILILAGSKPIVVNLYVLIAGFFIYDFSELPATDLNALGFYLWAVFLALNILKGGWAGPWVILLFSIINFLPASLKFIYLPVVFISPAFLCIYGIKASSNPIKKAGIASLIITT